MLTTLGRHQRQSELGTDDGNVTAQPQQEWHGSDVILVAMGQDDRVDVVHPVFDVGEVRQDQVDAGLCVLGEQHTTVDDQQPTVVLEHRHVAADLADPAQRDYPQSVAGRPRRCAETVDGRHRSRLWFLLAASSVVGAAIPTLVAAATTPRRSGLWSLCLPSSVFRLGAGGFWAGGLWAGRRRIDGRGRGPGLATCGSSTTGGFGHRSRTPAARRSAINASICGPPAGTCGSRGAPTSSPKSCSDALTIVTPPSRPMALTSGSIEVLISRAVRTSPLSKAICISRRRSATRWPITLTKPVAPTDNHGRLSASSPDRYSRSVEAMMPAAECRSPFASLTALIRGCSARASIVSLAMGTTDRGGMS